MNYFLNLFQENKSTKKDDTQYDQVINGSYDAKHILIHNSLCINGQATLEQDVITKKNITINGQLLAKEVIFESDLTVNGDTLLQTTKIMGHAQIRGRLKAQGSMLGLTNLLASESFFNHCQIQNLTIEKLPFKTQHIHLSNNTSVLGDVVFDSGNGFVHCDATSKIQGTIIGGQLIQG